MVLSTKAHEHMCHTRDITFALLLLTPFKALKAKHKHEYDFMLTFLTHKPLGHLFSRGEKCITRWYTELSDIVGGLYLDKTSH